MMNILRDAIWEAIEDMDTKDSSASTYLVQTYFDTLKYNLSDRVITAIMEGLAILSETTSENQAELIAININRLVRTVAA